MIHRLIQITIFVFLVSYSGTAVFAQSNIDSLKPYTACKVRGDLKIREVTHRDSKKSFREVIIGSEKKQVSVVDGYRVMFAYPDLPYYFANVKIEQSSAESYDKDKEILINQMKYFTTTKEPTGMILSDMVLLNGFAHYGLDRDKIDVGGTVGTHILFHDSKHLVITIYFLNQSKAAFFNNRRFESIKEYHELKDDFLNSYSQCLKSVADAR